MFISVLEQLIIRLRSIFMEIILPLARAWNEPEVLHKIKQHLVIFKPKVSIVLQLANIMSLLPDLQVFPSLFDWVSYPIALLIERMYKQEIEKVNSGKAPCHMCIELVACLERVLCFCHTGNTSVFATSLMDPLGLSKGAMKDGFPVLLNIFDRPLLNASKEGFCVDASKWPLKGHYPAVASKRAQVLTYSIKHYMVSIYCTTVRA